jgi:hypothetical protein
MTLRYTQVCLHDFGYQLPPVELLRRRSRSGFSPSMSG